MADPRVFTVPVTRPNCLQAGIVSKIYLENFMCHSSLDIELGDWVNLITGQNGSGKSAIVTALRVAFGSPARGTQRANTIKDFIKTGSSYALVRVEMKNQGEDAFRPEIYGDRIIVECRITASTSPITLKNSEGRRVAAKREDLREIVKHFNIDVENPCVIMSQDESREFLHSENAKDKFKFFFKATPLLHQEEYDLLKGMQKQLSDATALVDHREESLRPILKEINELQEKIKSMEFVEEISQQVQSLKRKLAWSWVYDTERKLDEKQKIIEKLKARIPSCQAKIDENHKKMEELTDQLTKKKSQISMMIEKTSGVLRMKDDLQHCLSMALTKMLELEEEKECRTWQIQRIVEQAKVLDCQIHDLQEQNMKHTQAEESEMDERLQRLQAELDEANIHCQRLREEEEEMMQRKLMVQNEVKETANKIEGIERRHIDISSRIHELQMHQRNKVTAFGGDRVTNLLQAIERNQHKFNIPPIGPVGVHLELRQADIWSAAIENAVGRLLDAFIVNDHKDSLVLRACAKEAKYTHLQIIIYDFSMPRINLPRHMLPRTNHPTAFSVMHSDNTTVMNVLIDVAGAERQVLVKDYDVGKTVAFDQNLSNLKEVYTSDGYRMFSRGSAQTILPPNKNLRTGRLCSSYENEIRHLEIDALEAKAFAQEARGVKRIKEDECRNLQQMYDNIKRRRMNMDRQYRTKEFALEDAKKSLLSEATPGPASSVDGLHQEISKLRDAIRENIEKRMNEAKEKTRDIKMSLKNLAESAKSEIDALAEAENERLMIEKDLHSAEGEKKHYEELMINQVLSDIKYAEATYQELDHSCKENHRKASIICPESEIEALGGYKESSPEQLSSELSRLRQRLERESRRFSESFDDLRMLCEKKERKISRNRKMYHSFREKLDAFDKALNLRQNQFLKNASLLKRQLTSQFNRHLGKRGISGHIKVNYAEQTLSIEVKMPQDASSSNARDTRGLSGGERSVSTLCFALALHGMTKAPFRAMDEFDVFMDAVSRKISLDTLVDFALAQGSQWIFITPRDISMVNNDERIKKQQMAPPRG